ncbi:hypothetical protein LguiB_028096 [Lonicera macranthoides]
MADSVVSFVLDNLSQLLKHEASMLVGVEDDIKSLYIELIQINQFLQDSKGKREMVKDLVSLIRNVAHRAEDVIDRYVINMAKHKRRNMLKKFWHSLEHTTMLRNVAKDIRRIKNEIATIYSSRERYGIEDKGAHNDSLEKRRALNRHRSKVEEIEVVGFVNDFKTVMDMLSKTDLCLDVISIVGMGGIGKTTLAKKIYNSKLVKERFDCCAWVNVSQEFETKELLLNILRNVAESTEGMYNMNEDELAEEMRKLLQGTRYFIVLDDVWDTEVWDGIKDAFPDNLNGCRILVTSRLNEVALHLSRAPPYSLRILDKNNSWELFSKKAFRENFLAVLTDEVFTTSATSTSTDTTIGTRRLSTHCSTPKFFNSVHYDSSRVRSLLCFGDPCELNIKNFRTLYKEFQLLRVLDLGSTMVLGVPTKVEELIHLRYMRMNAPQLSEIPSCISNLPKLQTLDLRE